jgi:Domain of unknown function (DUF4412)
MKAILPGILPAFAHLLLIYQAQAQFYQPIMIDPSALKFFDEKSAFNANAEFIAEEDGKPVVTPLKIAILGNLTRVEMDISKVRGGKASVTEYYRDMKTAGSAESVSIFNPDKKCAFTILPRLKAYLQTPIPEKELEEMKHRPKAVKIELGTETIDGQACTKYRITFDADRQMDVWRTWESKGATVWIPKAAPACPMRMDVIGSNGRTNGTFLIKGVESVKMDKKMFEPPKGFAKCENPGALMKIIMENWPKDKTK